MGYWSAFWNVYRELKLQKQFNRSYLLPYLHSLEQRHNGHFSPEQRQKIVSYYGLFITAFLCSSYKRLYGQRLTKEERTRATLFGILTPVGDDLFDVDQLDYGSIRQITFSPETYQPHTFSGQVAKEIQAYLLSHVPHKEPYLAASKAVLDIQEETIRQTDPHISPADLERITCTKGAVSVIIYHQCLDMPATPPMLEALHEIGSLYQLGNDLFDLFKDVRDHIFTLVNTCPDFSLFRQQFLQRVQRQNSLIMSLPCTKRRKKDFCIVMNTINARSLVAIDQLVRLQQANKGPIDWGQRPRKDMIVDMEKPANIARWLYYVYALPKLRTAAPDNRSLKPAHV